MENKKTKICLVASVDITLKFILLSLLKNLSNKGYDVYAVCSPGKWVKDLEAQGIKIKTISIKRKISPFSDLISLFNLFSYFKKEKFDIVCTFTPKPGLLGQMAAKMAGTPAVFNTIFGFYFNEETPYFKRKFYILIEKIAAIFSDVIFFRNREDFDTASAESIGSNAKNEFIGDGIDISRFNAERFTEDSITDKKQQLRIFDRKIVVGIVARLVEEKGYLDLFCAFKKITEKFQNALLLVVGGTDFQKKDKIAPGIVENYGIKENVLFLGERTDVDELFSVMDIFVLPSWREGFSHSIMEAEAMGKPVIASDIRGCRGAIDNKTGILVPSRNCQKLYEAILYLIGNTGKAKKMGQEGRKKAEKEFDEKIIFKKMEKRFQDFSKVK